MNFIEAVKFAKSRGAVMPEDFYALAALDSRARMFTVSSLKNLDQIKQVQTIFNKVLDDGGTINDFKKGLSNAEIELPNGRAETIFRTNSQTAYNQGRLDQILRNARTHPKIMYDAIDDARTRESHRALNGLIFDVVTEQHLWSSIFPPNGFNCRCRFRPLTDGQAKRREDIELQQQRSQILNENGADKGFEGLPRTPEQLRDMVTTRVVDLELSPAILDASLAKLDSYLEPIITQKAAQNVSEAVFLDILANPAALEIASQKTVLNSFRPAYNIAGSLTVREAAVIADYLISDSGLNSFLKTGAGTVNLTQQRYLSQRAAALHGTFENRTALNLNWNNPLYLTVNESSSRVGSIITFDGFAKFSRLNQTSGSIIHILKNKYGRMLPVESLSKNSGAFLADVGQSFVVTRVQNDSYYNRKLWKKIIHIEAADQTLSQKILTIIADGRRFWQADGGLNA